MMLHNYFLEDLCDVTIGRTPPRKEFQWFNSKSKTDMKWVSIKDLGNCNKFIYDTSETLTQKAVEKFKIPIVKKGTIILSFKLTVGRVAIAGCDLLTNEAIAHLKIKRPDLLDRDFLYYYLLNYHWQTLGSTSSIATAVNSSMIKKMVISIPEKPIQMKIASALNIIDKKISINDLIVKDLYQLFDLSYQHLYLNKIDKNPTWQIIPLGELTSKFCTGLNPRKNFKLGYGSNFYVTIKNMGNNNIFLDDKCDKIDDLALKIINKRSDLKKGDLLFSGIGTIGRVYLIHENPTNWNISESVFTLRPNNKINSVFLYAILLSKDLQNYTNSLASGSAQKGIRKSDFVKYKVAVPDKQTLDELSLMWNQIVDIIYEKNNENLTLNELKNSLLKKLIL